MNNETKICDCCKRVLSIEAKSCPHCGKPFKLKEEKPSGVLEVLCILSLLFSLLLSLANGVYEFASFMICLSWLLFYEIQCKKLESKNCDYSKYRQTRNTILIFGILLFVKIVITIG